MEGLWIFLLFAGLVAAGLAYGRARRGKGPAGPLPRWKDDPNDREGGDADGR